MKIRTASRVLVGGTVLACIAIAALVTTTAGRGPDAAPPLFGTPLGSVPAPGFGLRNQDGTETSLRAQRGHVVILTFFYTHCPDTCPMTAQKLRTVLRGLGSEARRVRVLIVSTDPVGDTPATARAFLQRHGDSRWSWLLGSYARLRRVWLAYHIYAAPPALQARLGPTHTAGMYLIDVRGRERQYLDDSLPAVQIANDLHIMLDDHRWSVRMPVAPVAGAQAPEFALSSLRGPSVNLRRLRGRPVVLNFWATWCVPCRREMPLLEREHRALGRRVDFVGVDEQEPTSEASAYVTSLHITYPIALDVDGNVGYMYQLNGTPTTFFLDHNGVIRHITPGALTPSQLLHELPELTTGSGSGSGSLLRTRRRR